MTQKFELTLIPSGGLNKQTDPGDSSLFKFTDQTMRIARTEAVDGDNWECYETPGVCKKRPGYEKYNTTKTAASDDDRWQALKVLDDGTNYTLCGVYKGKFYTITTSAITKIEEAGGSPVTFDTSVPICLAQYGAYMIIACIGDTPYKWKVGDANLTKLILSGTEYKFKFVESYQNRVIGAYSNQTNGNLDIRYTDALPTIASLSFPAANQLYKPDDDVGITGLKKMGNHALLLYGERSIHSLDYYSDYSPVFSITPQATNLGTSSPFSIVDTGDAHYFLDKERGFVKYVGGRQFQVISEKIEPLLSTMENADLKYVIGKHVAEKNILVWSIPEWGGTYPIRLVMYDMTEEQWYTQTIPATCMEYIEKVDSYSLIKWREWLRIYGNTWVCGTDIWSLYMKDRTECFVFGNTTGYVYVISGYDYDDTDFEAFRTEPILSLPDEDRYKRLIEVHFMATDSSYNRAVSDSYDSGLSSFSIDVYHRGANNKQSIIEASWTLIGSISMASSSTMKIYTDQTYKYHQIKWGTDLKNEPFEVNQIKLKGVVY